MPYPYVNKSNYDFMQKMVKMFKIGDNAKTGRTASIANNSNLEQNDLLCAKMILQVVKVADDYVKSKSSNGRAASIVSSSIDEVAELKELLK